MKFVLFFAVAIAVPQFSYSAPTGDSSEELHVVPIVKYDNVHGPGGSRNVEVETGNGIALSRSYSFDSGAQTQAGQYSYTAPDGAPVVVKFVANEFGYQPESDYLPVAPAFPHPIPQFVLDQIAFAAQEDADRDSDEV
ncbi:endocuticle structural glycoprotein SgAbd-8-like [Panulirus ornatus]|uniref:endocuticle structural glycoprotein SgAbd-8-like n=1 Tax=Panulirus ornatus TaxID=150431 RepID=UPI003A849A03